MSERPLSQLDRVYGARDLRELEQTYDRWAETYDEDVHRLGHLLRTVSTGYIERFVSPDSRVLDAGSGTGLIGGYLRAMGYRDLTAIDLSEGMLARARARGCYRMLYRMVLGEPLDFPNDAFDAAFSVGVFTEGHAPPESLEELARVVRNGGEIVFSIRDDVYRERGFREVQSELESRGVWQRRAASRVFQPYPGIRPELRSRVFVYERTRIS